MAVKQTKTTARVKKKKWYPIYAPKEFNEAFVGETHSAAADTIIGKTVKVNLMNLIGDIKKQNTNIKFLMNDVKDDKVRTEPVAFELMPSSLKRFVRRRKDKIDDSYLYTTSDGKRVRLKLLMLTRSNTKKSVLTSLRKNARGILYKHISKITFSSLFMEVVQYKLQKNLKHMLSKIYPVRILEVKALYITGKVKKPVTSAPEKKPAPKTEKKEAPEAEKKDAPKAEKKEVKKAPEEPKKEAPEKAKKQG